MRNERGHIGVIIALILGLLALYLLVFWWEYTTIAPWLGVYNSWSDGFWHGMFAVPNFIVNFFTGHAQSPLYATGGSGWYNFWYLLGVGALLGGSSSSSSRRNRD